MEDKVGEGISCFSLGLDFECLGFLHEALDYYGSSLELLDTMRALLQSEDSWKITFRDPIKMRTPLCGELC